VHRISCKKEREGESGKTLMLMWKIVAVFFYNNADVGDSDVDVDDGNIYGGSFCPSPKTTMVMLMMMAACVGDHHHHNHHLHKWQPCVSQRLLMLTVMVVACVSIGYDDVDDDGGSLV